VKSYAVVGDRLDERTRLALANAVPVLPTIDVAVPRSAVSTPGVRGNVRRPQLPQPSRPVNETVLPNGSRTVAPVAPIATDAVTPGVRSRRPAGDPAYAPPRTWNSGDARRGSVRDPRPLGSGDPQLGSGRNLHPTAPSPRGGDPGLTPGSERARVPAGASSQTSDPPNTPVVAEPRAVPRSEPRPSTWSGSNRGEGREPRAAAPPPPPSSPPPSERSGGAVERGGASRREPAPAARGDSGGDSRPQAPSAGAQGGARRRPPL
jgi:hypothetical protein